MVIGKYQYNSSMNADLLWLRLHASATVEPSWWQLIVSCLALGCLALTVLPFGLWSGFLTWSPMSSKRKAAGSFVRSLVFPALVEEAFWRGALLPQPSVDAHVWSATLWWTAGLNLVLFTLYHVPAGYLMKCVRPGAFAVFTDWRFSVVCVGLGTACIGSYMASGGALWVATVVHWLPVAGWLAFFGGEAQLAGADVDTYQSLTDAPSERG